jgi:4'-phosphopantetheinyl transferase
LKRISENASLMSDAWTDAPPSFSLRNRDVHLWRAWLDGNGYDLARVAAVLNEDEQRRAGRFRFDRDRRRFIFRRAFLRTILGCYLGVDPARLRFRDTTYGKPELVGRGDLRFNASSSQDLAVYAIARGRAVGIDVERVAAAPWSLALAERFFSPGEVRALRSLDRSLQATAFFRCWTRKEALLKAAGVGLSLALDSFEVSLRPEDPAALLAARPGGLAKGRWSLAEIVPAPGYVGALARQGPKCLVRFCEAPQISS